LDLTTVKNNVIRQLPASEYYILHQLADSVFAAVGKVDSPAFSNAGIVDTGDQTLIFDTFNASHAAADLRDAAEILTGRPGDIVVISHAHDDHWMGNQVFAGQAAILATQKTRDAIVQAAAYIYDSQQDPEEYSAYLNDIEARLAEAEEPRLRAHLSWTAAIVRHQYLNLGSLKPAYPDQTFDGRVVFHGSVRQVVLYTPGAGHTESDAILALPADSVAFIGDLGFFRTHPYLGDSTPEKWITTLEALAAGEIGVFVPGHGPVGTKEDLIALKNYIRALDKLAAEVVEAGGSEEDAVRQPLPDFADNWAGFGRFERSMRFLYRLKLGT
jgi:glyoxylase-like metal-dependent hydrolase (beta-lactamase superfamily II)